ncbi:MAG: ABC transporter ATP-binding protein, partial [Pseudomonadota bacterium]|nr:ABC transporter ATP-binding protein [Pseudomonadota bacterium]
KCIRGLKIGNNRNMAFLEFEDIDKSFGENNVISNFNLKVEKGHFIVLLGPSGCGKSTLLRMIAGLEKIDKGEIRLEKNLLNDLLPSKRKIAMVFQSYALYPHMNVFNNISFGLINDKLSKSDITNKVHEAAKILKIEELLDRKPKELSGGQRQRVAIGRAITRNPKLFLFDEPLSNLDAALRSEMRVEISKLHKRLKSNIIYVTHDQIEAMTLADKIVIMNEGNIEQFGTPDDIYNDPKNVFVAEFIGNPKMNIIKIKKEDIVNKNTLNLFNNKIYFENSNFNNDLYIGIRPEDISFENKSEIAVEVTIDLIENLGSEKIIYAHLNGTEIRIKNIKNIKEKNITIYLPKNKLYLFDNNKNRLKL